MPITIGCLRKGFLLFHLVTTLGLLASNVRAGLTVPVAQVKAVSGENDAGSGTSDVCNINDCQSIPCNLRRFTFYTQKTGALIKLHSKTNNGELTVCGWSVKDDAMYTLVQVSKVKGQSINGVNKPRIPFKVAWNKIKEVDQYWIGKNEFIKLASNSNVLLDFQVKRLNSTNIDVYCLFTNVRITEENELTSENTNCSHSRDLVYNNLYESNNDNKSKAFCDDIYNSIVNVSNSDAFLSCIIKLLNSVIIDEGESSRVTYTSVIVIGQEKKCDSIVECGKPKQCVYKSNKIGMACECPMKLCDVGMYVKQSNCKCVCNEEGNACSEHEEIDKEKSNNYTVILTFVIAILVMFTLIIFIVKAKKTINNQTLKKHVNKNSSKQRIEIINSRESSKDNNVCCNYDEEENAVETIFDNSLSKINSKSTNDHLGEGKKKRKKKVETRKKTSRSVNLNTADHGSDTRVVSVQDISNSKTNRRNSKKNKRKSSKKSGKTSIQNETDSQGFVSVVSYATDLF